MSVFISCIYLFLQENVMSKKSRGRSKTTLRYRDAKTGLFLTDQQGKRRPPAKVVHERVPKPGFGDTK